MKVLLDFRSGSANRSAPSDKLSPKHDDGQRAVGFDFASAELVRQRAAELLIFRGKSGVRSAVRSDELNYMSKI